MAAFHERGMDVDEILVRRLWDNEECPYFDLIMRADGRIYPLQPNGQKIADPYCTNSVAWMRISQLPGIDDSDNLNEGFASLYRKDLPDLDLVLSCGECCSSGENGFVSLARLSTGALIWLVFLTSSNPFESAEIDQDEVIATSTDGLKFIFRLENPESVRMVGKARLSYIAYEHTR
ncbi:hypothetical protein INH39_03995 [Massilia violaceinigra]|uniref:Uncharacterized protein n=1 Tax=Massilia violaceinigra TaxID=2045208 RepID=A0ABY4A7Z9_9BURK|nr:hypothetical protein [Massilia violaceinigra]UOD30906.1 hypothetical protein INH39_03995 [Massilia violaceinigra]